VTIACLPRKEIRRFEGPGAIHELTFSCYHHEPLIERADAYADLARTIGRACEKHGYELLCFVLMPDHVHLVLRAKSGASGIAVLLQAIKRPVSYRAHLELRRKEPRLCRHLTRLGGGQEATFRFWQAGPGYDRSIVSLTAAKNAIDYLHRNPVRQELVDHAADWVWSSFRQWEGMRPLAEGLPRIFPFEL